MAEALLGGLGLAVGRGLGPRSALALALPRALLLLARARGRCCSLLQRRQPSGGSRTLQLPTKLPCSPCDVTVVQQRSKPGREWEGGAGAGSGGGGAGAERQGAARGRAPQRSCPRSPVFIEMQITRGSLPPRRRRGVQGGLFSRSGSPGIWGGGVEVALQRGTSRRAGRPHAAGGRPHGGGTVGFGGTLFRSRENGLISENATRAPTGGEAAKESQRLHLLSFSLTRVNFRNH